MGRHRERALELAQSLRLKGIEANIDQYIEHDPPTWPRWMLDEVRGADFVLCLVSPPTSSEPKAVETQARAVALAGRAL